MAENLFRKIEILIVDDIEFDVEFLSDVLTNKCKIACNIGIAMDGEEAIKYLEKIAANKDMQAPDFIFLDLNMPKISGFEVLKWIKDSNKFKDIPVCIFTSSESERDILQSYREKANFYTTKPPKADEIVSILLSVKECRIAFSV